MKITILGCGNSLGVPVVGCECAVCTSDNPRNKRLRVSAAVEIGDKRLIIDTSTDFRQQMLRAGIKKIDAVLYTHDHADHVHGIDDLRAFNFGTERPIPIYGSAATIDTLKQRFAYAFVPPKQNIIFCPNLEGKAIAPQEMEEKQYADFYIENIKITAFEQGHGKFKSTGYRIGDFAYSTDVDELPEVAFSVLSGVKCWVVDCLRYTKSYSHANLEKTLEWIARVRPETAVFTHMAHDFDYDKLSSELPSGVFVGYDGMVLELGSR